MAEGEYSMCEGFGIDNGELDGLSPQECFVYGYELCSVANTVSSFPERELNFTVHIKNRDRIEAFIMKRGRNSFAWIFPKDDKSEDWVYLTVYPATNQ